MKTPEQMAEEWCETWYQQQASDGVKVGTERAFLAGYQAARLNSEGISSTQSIGVQAAKDQLADGGKVMPEWISVEERLPKEGEQIFVVYSGEHCKDVHLSCYENGWSSLIDVTHWMPLPEAPKDE